MLKPFEKFFLATPVIFEKLVNINDIPNRPSVYKKNIPDTIKAVFSEPDYIIDNIYLGGTVGACNYDFLENNDIKYVVNISDNVPNIFREREIDYLKIDKKDDGKEDLTREDFENAYKFILDTQEGNKKVLVHCFAGQSRSVAILIYYLNKKHSYTIQQSLDLLKERRKWVNPSTKFIDNLTLICEKEEI
jgi:protein-tyrosine phosphatase